jgi:hypothetical protein
MNNDSSWGDRPASPLDRAIDRAVRRIMHVDPPAGLRRRVLSRLEPRAARRALFLPRYALAAAALAILVLSVMFMGKDRGVPVRHDTASSTASGTPAQLQRAATPQPAADRAENARAASPGFTRDPIPMPRVANIFGARTRGVSAAAESGAATVWTDEPGGPASPANAVPPLVIAPLTPAAIETPAIVIPPLVVAGPPKGGL